MTFLKKIRNSGKWVLISLGLIVIIYFFKVLIPVMAIGAGLYWFWRKKDND